MCAWKQRPGPIGRARCSIGPLHACPCSQLLQHAAAVAALPAALFLQLLLTLLLRCCCDACRGRGLGPRWARCEAAPRWAMGLERAGLAAAAPPLDACLLLPRPAHLHAATSKSARGELEFVVCGSLRSSCTSAACRCRRRPTAPSRYRLILRTPTPDREHSQRCSCSGCGQPRIPPHRHAPLERLDAPQWLPGSFLTSERRSRPAASGSHAVQTRAARRRALDVAMVWCGTCAAALDGHAKLAAPTSSRACMLL
jgi:hypothetical protein